MSCRHVSQIHIQSGNVKVGVKRKVVPGTGTGTAIPLFENYKRKSNEILYKFEKDYILLNYFIVKY